MIRFSGSVVVITTLNLTLQTGKDSLRKTYAPITPAIGSYCKEMFYTCNPKSDELSSTCRMIALAFAKTFSIARRSSAQSSQISALNSFRSKIDDCCINRSSLVRFRFVFSAAVFAAFNLRSLRYCTKYGRLFSRHFFRLSRHCSAYAGS